MSNLQVIVPHDYATGLQEVSRDVCSAPSRSLVPDSSQHPILQLLVAKAFDRNRIVLYIQKFGGRLPVRVTEGCLLGTFRFDSRSDHRIVPPVALRRPSWNRKEVSHRLAEVKINDGESIESALRRFKRRVQQEDIIKEVKKHSYYMKPGDKRRAKQALARKRQRKKMRREQGD